MFLNSVLPDGALFNAAVPLSGDLWLIMVIVAGVFGACVGSFLNVCIYRIPLDLSVVTPRSFCPHCKKTIPWYLNIPVLSYFMLRGRCRFCGSGFSFRYALVEMFTAFLFVLGCLAFPPAGAEPPLGMQALPTLGMLPVYWLFISGLILGTFVDFEHYIIPDSVTIGGMGAGLVLSLFVPAMHGADSALLSLRASFIGLATGFGILQGIAILGRLAFRKEAMGFGDVKLMGAVGAFLGWKATIFSILAASLFGTIVGVTLIACGKRQMGSRIPFGPYLSLGAFVWIFWGQPLWNAYFSLFRV